MEDADSGIFQSRTESTFGEADLTESDAQGASNSSFDEPQTSESEDQEDSDADSISSLSDDANVSSSEDEEAQSHTNETPSSPTTLKQTSIKKRLTITDGGIDGPRAKSIHDLMAGLRITHEEGKRDEHWEFEDGLHSKLNLISPTVNERTTPKRVLKLQLSNLSNKSGDASTTSPDTPESIADTTSGLSLVDGENNFENEISPSGLHFEFRDPDILQCSEWRRLFSNDSYVKVSCQDVLQGRLDHDAVVIPGNSFGFLDGEPEIQYTEKFGWKLQEEIQKVIWEKYDGELLVGQALIVPIPQSSTKSNNHASIGCAIYAPVMRVPLQVGDTVNAYLAFRAILREVKLHNEHSCEEDMISTVICPSLCNGFGSMPTGRIALQMKTAYDAIIAEKRPDIRRPKDLGLMATHHVALTTKTGNWC